MSLLKILVVIILILFPFGELLRFSLGSFIYLKPVDVLSVVFAICTVVVYIRNKSYRSSLRWYFFFFPFVGLISLCINSFWLHPKELFTSFLYLLRWVSYLSVFFAVIQFDEGFRNKIIRFLIIDGIVILLIGFFQYFFYQSLQNLAYLGWDRHEYRLYSSFFDPNYVGAFFVLYLTLIAGHLFVKAGKLKRRVSLFYIIVAIFTFIAVLLTYSRSALLMLIVSGMTFFLLMNKKKYIFYLLGIIAAFIIISSPFFYIENVDLFRLNSSMARVTDIQHALKIGIDHPILGIGFDAYRYAQENYHFTVEHMKAPSNAASSVDTSFIFVFATTGLIGLLAYGNLWYQLLKKSVNKKNRFSVIFFVSVVGLLINSFFNNSLFYEEIMFWMWMIAGLMYVNA